MDGENRKKREEPDHLNHILVIEDEEAMSKVYEDYFTDMGYVTTLAKTGAEALEHLFKKDYSVVISDLILPDQHGVDIFRKVKKHKLEKVSPAWVMITGHASFNSPGSGGRACGTACP